MAAAAAVAVHFRAADQAAPVRVTSVVGCGLSVGASDVGVAVGNIHSHE